MTNGPHRNERSGGELLKNNSRCKLSASFLGELFEREPSSFGLRGDPYLWKALHNRFKKTPLPRSTGELARLLQKAFEEETGFVLALLDRGLCRQFAHGGMSSGQIDGFFWREVAFPLVISRFQQTDRTERCVGISRNAIYLTRSAGD